MFGGIKFLGAALLGFPLGAFVLADLMRKSNAASIDGSIKAEVGGSGAGVGSAFQGIERAGDEAAIKRPIGLREVRQIVELCERDFDYDRDYDSAVVRNLCITMAYYDLSIQMDALIGHRNLNWCTFALWASNTAGMTIRKQFPPFPDLLIRLMSPIPFFGAIVKGSSEATIVGNLKVFDEIGPLFAEMFERFKYDQYPDSEKLQEFLDEIRAEGERLDDPMLLDNMHLMRAFQAYHEAVYEDDVDAKAEKILLANCLIGLHEQTRLQEQIARAMELPVSGSKTLKFLEDHVSKGLADSVAGMVQLAARLFATSFMLNYRTPSKTLPLGGDILVRTGMFPPELETIELDELREILEEFDYKMSTLPGRTPRDWANIRQRMPYIVELFVTHQRHREFLVPPFTPAQQAELERRARPRGKLDGRYGYTVS